MNKAQKTRLTPSLEDYLEAILAQVHESNFARVRDIAKRLQVGKPAVTAALKSLANKNLVNYDPYQLITLTSHGQQLAEAITRRHKILSRFFYHILGLEKSIAETNACRIEHGVDDVVLQRLHYLMDYLEQDSNTEDNNWLESFSRFCSERTPTSDM